MSKALVPVTKESWDVIQSVAPVVQASRMFGVTVEQASIVMLKGHELGLGIASAFEFVHVIDAKPSLAPKGALALIQRSGELEGLKIDDQVDNKGNPTACAVWMKRTNGFEYNATFTTDDAKRAGLIKKGSGWEKYPANMLRWRAIGYCADIVFPDVIGGMYRPEELGANVDEEGAPIEGTWTVGVSPPDVAVDTVNAPIEADIIVTDEVANTETPVLTLESIIAKYGAEAILAINDNQIPQNEDARAVVAAKLESAQREAAVEDARREAAAEEEEEDALLK